MKMRRFEFKLPGMALAVALMLLSACSSAPRLGEQEAAAHRAVQYALNMQGKPYRYGGTTPHGFDCSGLVHYSYSRAGVELPRSTEGLRDRSRTISTRELRPGDLLFFDQEGKRSSHVALYVGDDRFVHAPSTGKRVTVANFADPYWRRHFASARRPLAD